MLIGSAFGIWAAFWQYWRMVTCQTRMVVRDDQGNVVFGAGRVAVGLLVSWLSS